MKTENEDVARQEKLIKQDPPYEREQDCGINLTPIPVPVGSRNGPRVGY